jgi:hypothetical protein
MSQEPTKGYIVVASRSKSFYNLAINLVNSIKDLDPEAKVCLVTEKLFCDGKESSADHLIYCGDHVREKLTALTQSPFEITMYIDADCEVQHEDISTAFDMLDGHDLMFTPLLEERSSYFKNSKWENGRLEINGGVFVYDTRKSIVKDFMKDWDHYYRLQSLKIWWPDMKDGRPDYSNHPQHLQPWDQFTLWWLINKNPKYKDIKLKFFDEEVRWNWYSTFSDKENYTGKPPVIFHYSGTGIKNKY